MDSRVNHPNPKSLPWIFIVFEEAQLSKQRMHEKPKQIR